MVLSQNLLSEFAKLTSNNNITKKETIVRGRVIKQNGNYLFNMLDTNSKIPVKIPSGLDLNYPVNAIIKNNSISVIGNVIDPETDIIPYYELKDKLVLENTEGTIGNIQFSLSNGSIFNTIFHYIEKIAILNNISENGYFRTFNAYIPSGFLSGGSRYNNFITDYKRKFTLTKSNNGINWSGAFSSDIQFITNSRREYKGIAYDGGYDSIAGQNIERLRFKTDNGYDLIWDSVHGWDSVNSSFDYLIFYGSKLESSVSNASLETFLTNNGSLEDPIYSIVYSSNDSSIKVFENGEWLSDEYKKIIFNGDINDNNLLSFLKNNNAYFENNQIGYDDELVYDEANNGWTNNYYRYITFTSNPSDANLIKFLNVNSEKINIVSSTYKSIDDDFIKNL